MKTSTNGRLVGNLRSAMDLLRSSSILSDAFAFDEMARAAILQKPLPSRGSDDVGIDDEVPRPVRDTDVIALQEYLQRHGLVRLSKATAHDAVDYRASERAFHPVRDWLNSLKWDGVERLDSWLATYLGAEDTAYVRGIGPMFLIAMVARVHVPGAKADYMVILEGPQGVGKSAACAILGGDWFSENLPNVNGGKEVSQHLRDKWLVEIAELAPLNKAEDAALKAFLTRTVERYRPSYGRREVDEPRQCIFIGTTNKSTYLKDETGGRRFWPVKVGKIDIVQLKADRSQLFAEALVRYQAGARWYPDIAFEAAYIRPQQDARYEADPWEEIILEHIANKPRVSVTGLACDALGLQNQEIGTAIQRRISAILVRAGWKPIRDNDGRGYIQDHDA